MALTYEPRALSGRCVEGERDKGRLWHAVAAGQSRLRGKAICGAKPGRLSGAGWGDQVGAEVSCVRCLRRLEAERKREDRESTCSVCGRQNLHGTSRERVAEELADLYAVLIGQATKHSAGSVSAHGSMSQSDSYPYRIGYATGMAVHLFGKLTQRCSDCAKRELEQRYPADAK